MRTSKMRLFGRIRLYFLHGLPGAPRRRKYSDRDLRIHLSRSANCFRTNCRPVMVSTIRGFNANIKAPRFASIPNCPFRGCKPLNQFAESEYPGFRCLGLLCEVKIGFEQAEFRSHVMNMHIRSQRSHQRLQIRFREYLEINIEKAALVQPAHSHRHYYRLNPISAAIRLFRSPNRSVPYSVRSRPILSGLARALQDSPALSPIQGPRA